MADEDTKIALRVTTHQDTAFAWGLYRDLMKPLTEELLDWNEPLQRRLIEQDMASGDASIIAVDGQAAGWILVRETDEQLNILQLYLLPGFQNKRIGTSIIRQLIDHSRATARALHLEVMKNNRARLLYERLGFVVIDESEYKLHMTWRDNGI